MKKIVPATWMSLALLLTQAHAAAAEGIKPETWASSMLARLPFRDGHFDRNEFHRRSGVLLAQIESYYRDMSDSALKRAAARGSGKLAAMVRSRTERLVADAVRYVRETERGMALTIDPSGASSPSLGEARQRLTALAVSADTDGNGILDRFEAALAEAAFAKGLDLSAPGVVDRLSRELAWSYAGAD